MEAIDARDWDELIAELGDLLLQVLFYAEMAYPARRLGCHSEPERSGGRNLQFPLHCRSH
ncbi:MAG TPA: MazG nucleotide pyrophosphohydrolase domain-containing protein [Bryobacteraceae bacterium]